MINQTKFSIMGKNSMFDPNNPDDGDFREECALGAGMLLEYIADGEPGDLEDPVALGALIVAAAALAKMQAMDLHELLGAMMSAYRGTNVMTVDREDDDEEGEDDDTRH